MNIRNWALPLIGALVLTHGAIAQTTTIEGDVKGEDGKPLQGAVIKIDRTDIKGAYKVKTDKKGHFLHAGLPSGTYNITVEVEGKDVDKVQNYRAKLGDNPPLSFDLQAAKKQAEAQAAAQQAGAAQNAAQAEASKDATRGMSAAEKAALEKQQKEREAQMAKNKELNDSFQAGLAAIQAKQWDQAVTALTKAGELDANQHVVWAQLAEAYMGLAAGKTGSEFEGIALRGLDAYQKAIAIKPDDPAYHNNYALALVKAKKMQEAQDELNKAAQLDPPNAARYYYNLGAVLVNSGNTDASGDFFKKAIAANPDYADAQYQYGIYLISKANISADGKMTPVPGTAEAFQKYLELQPSGQFADAAKAMLQSMNATIDTSFSNPNAKKGTTKKK